jgi:long-subunit acyl-CoA synthetase (AMP-forming)
MDRNTLEQRMDILEILEKQVVFLENQELSSALSRFKSENTQWILNMLQDMLGQMQDALDLEDFSQSWS